MGKVVLVMDEPRNCGECILGSSMNEYHIKCASTKKGFSVDLKPNWCPLKPLSEVCKENKDE